jgi:para-aminobenzoate synthetase component 1
MVPTVRPEPRAPRESGDSVLPVSRTDLLAAEILARLPEPVAAAVARRDGATVVAVDPEPRVLAADGPDALRGLHDLEPGLWAGFCSFELGHAIERIAGRGASLDAAVVPDVVLTRFGAHATIAGDRSVSVAGTGAARDVLERALGCATTLPSVPDPRAPGWRSSLDFEEFAARVEAVLELLRAGECYQVNLTRQLVHDDVLDPVHLFARLAVAHPAPHLFFWRGRVGGRAVAVVSASPERFLRVDGDAVETRPIKGTAADARSLRTSPKDRAENVMIVDLARNDLGRVCEPGTVEVPALCAVEEHPGLCHLVSTVRARLRAGVGIGELVHATFPPASVTGAPKPRVLQAIEDLEPVRRGVYCGALGWIDTRNPGHVQADLAVGIRTFTMSGEAGDGHTHFGVGGGIVADSVPAAEWAETELKAARLLRLAGAPTRRLVHA